MSQVVGLRCAGARSAWRRTGFGSMRRGSGGIGPQLDLVQRGSAWFSVVQRGSVTLSLRPKLPKAQCVDLS